MEMRDRKAQPHLVLSLTPVHHIDFFLFQFILCEQYVLGGGGGGGGGGGFH